MNYRENHNWKAFTTECNRYNRMLDYNKRHHLLTKINEPNSDSKQLFRALNSILGNISENPLPTGTTDSQLAEEFANFFLNKIDKIREGFTNIPSYQLRQLDTPKLKKFKTVAQSHFRELGHKFFPTDNFRLIVIIVNTNFTKFNILLYFADQMTIMVIVNLNYFDK